MKQMQNNAIMIYSGIALVSICALDKILIHKQINMARQTIIKT